MTTIRAIETLQFRMVTHITSSLSHEVGDVDDHRLSLSTFSGLAFFADGMVGEVQFHSIADYIAGTGTFTLYPVIRFDDDSVLFLKSSGTGTVHGARTNFTGMVAVIGGRKRFEAVQGDGTLTGIRAIHHYRKEPIWSANGLAFPAHRAIRGVRHGPACCVLHYGPAIFDGLKAFRGRTERCGCSDWPITRGGSTARRIFCASLRWIRR